VLDVMLDGLDDDDRVVDDETDREHERKQRQRVEIAKSNRDANRDRGNP
jgi:hypothetical protein